MWCGCQRFEFVPSSIAFTTSAAAWGAAVAAVAVRSPNPSSTEMGDTDYFYSHEYWQSFRLLLTTTLTVPGYCNGVFLIESLSIARGHSFCTKFDCLVFFATIILN